MFILLAAVLIGGGVRRLIQFGICGVCELGLILTTILGIVSLFAAVAAGLCVGGIFLGVFVALGA